MEVHRLNNRRSRGRRKLRYPREDEAGLAVGDGASLANRQELSPQLLDRMCGLGVFARQAVVQSRQNRLLGFLIWSDAAVFPFRVLSLVAVSAARSSSP